MDDAGAPTGATDETGVANAGSQAKRSRADRRLLRRQALWHGAAGLGAIALFAALDGWRLATGLGVASALSVPAAIASGMVLAHLFHEWGHFAGARVLGSLSPVKEHPAALMFDFDYRANSPEQFLGSSVAGSLGNWLLVLLVALSIPLDAAGRAMLLATVAGMAVYVAILEWPVIAHARRHRDAIMALTHGFGRPGVFRRATRGGVVAGLLLWAVLML